MSEWNAIDLHMHTVVGVTGDGGKDEIKNFTYTNYISELKKHNIRLAAITNHNIIDMKNYLLCKYLAKKNNINILFGVEIDTDRADGKNYHCVFVFNEKFYNCFKIMEYINLNTENKKNNNGKVRYTPNEIVQILEKYDAIIIPHGDKSKGIFEEANEYAIKEALKKVKDGFIRVFDCRPSDWKMERIKQFLNSDKLVENLDDYGGVLFSDNRDWLNYGKRYKGFYMNAEPTFKGFLHSITNPVYRFATKDMIPYNSHYISRIVFESKNDFSKIVDCSIELKSGYNCIIGKSGSGKSLLQYLIRNRLSSTFESNNYGFSSNTNLKFYDENNSLISPGTINIATGQSIFERIINASESKDSTNMYKVIKLLDANFKEKIKYFDFIILYKQKLKDYVQLRDLVKNMEEELRSTINSFHTANKELINLKNIKIFDFYIEPNIEFEYTDNQLLQIKKIYKLLSQIKSNSLIFKEPVKSELKNKLLEYWNIYFNEYKKIQFEYNTKKLSNLKKEITRNALSRVNTGISNNASKKTKLLNEMPTNIKNIAQNIIDYYIAKRKVQLFDFSIKIEKINYSQELIKNSGIVVREEIRPNYILELNEKDNSIFYTYGHKQILSNNIVNMSKRDEANNLINKYYNNHLLSKENIDKAFSDNIIDVSVFFDGQNVTELNPGDIAKKYIKVYFSQLADGKNSIILYDQIENDVDKEFINETILPLINDIRFKAQIIIVTHDPIVAVNADPVNYIQSTKDKNGLIKYRSFVPESEKKDELNTIAKTVDGSKNVIKQRYEIYKGENEYGD